MSAQRAFEAPPIFGWINSNSNNNIKESVLKVDEAKAEAQVEVR